MTDEELLECEKSALMLLNGGYGPPAEKIARLIAEVRRLKAELKKRPNVSLEYIGRLPPSIFTEDDL